jgi:hypothetical protein
MGSSGIGPPKESQRFYTFELDDVVYVRVYTDGRVEYADGYEPDDEARRFWEEFAAEVLAVLEQS